MCERKGRDIGDGGVELLVTYVSDTSFCACSEPSGVQSLFLFFAAACFFGAGGLCPSLLWTTVYLLCVCGCVFMGVHVCACIWDLRVGLCGPFLLFFFFFPSYFPLMQPCHLALVPVRRLSPPSPTPLGAGVLCSMVGIPFAHRTLKGLSWAPWSFSSSL